MKKFYQIALNSTWIVLIWWGILSVFASYLVKNVGVTPSFPYYSTLLDEAGRAQAAWAHFDGAHYLHISRLGYDGTGIQAFFPIYPMIIRGLHTFLGIPRISAGIILSLASLVGTLICLNYLFGKRSKLIIAALLLFPTSYYLAAMYTESLFLFETVLFFLLLKQKRYLVAAVIAGLASGTRVLGVLLVAPLFFELYPRIKRGHYLSSLALLLISVTGLAGYSFFLWNKYSDPLLFFHVQSLFGAGRSSDNLITLPQVIWRYSRMILSVDHTSWAYGRIILEFTMFISAFWLWIVNLRKIPLSYSIFVGLSILLPTLSGTFLSFPRYVLVLVPFLVPPKTNRVASVIYLAVSATMLFYLLAQFVTGTFVA